MTDPKDLAQVKSVRIVAKDTEISFEDTLAATGESGALFLGEFDNARCRILMRWENLGLVENEILEATILLTSREVFGATSSKSFFTTTVHEVTTDWDETTVTNETLGNAIQSRSLGQGEILSTIEMTVGDTLLPHVDRIPLTTEGVELVNQWRDTLEVADNRGIVLDFASVNFLKAFEGRTSIDRPRLEMIVALDSTARDTLLFAPSGDAFLVEERTMLEPGPLYIDNAFSHQAVIKFRVDSETIPRETIINRAVLLLTVDSERSLMGETGFRFQIVRLAEEFQEPNHVQIDSTFAPLSLVIDQSSTGLGIPIESLVQDWVSALAENHGILIRSASPGADVSRMTLFSSASDSSSAPSLQIEFSVAPPGQSE
ncbi:hypothetical protein MJD09_15475 [bacterium]|nr:hypothetical protein [bacterium]